MTFALALSHSASSLMVLTSLLSADTDVTLMGAVLVSKALLVASLGGAKAAEGSLRRAWT